MTRHSRTPESDIVGTKPTPSLGPLFDAVAHGHSPVPELAGTSADASLEERPSPRAQSGIVVPVASASPLASGPEPRGSVATSNTPPHIGGGGSSPVRTERPDDHALAAASTDDAEQLLVMAERAANAILDAQRWMTVGLVRAHLGTIGKLANNGKEKLASLGALGRRMKLKALPFQVRAPEEIEVAHGNLGTIWVRPSDYAEMLAYWTVRLAEEAIAA